LLAAGRRDESIRWFLHAAQADDEELTDAADRLAELAEPESAGSEIAGSETVDPEIAGSEAAAGEPAGSVLADVVVAGNSAEPSGDPDR